MGILKLYKLTCLKDVFIFSCFIVCVMLRIYYRICWRNRCRKRYPDTNEEEDIRMRNSREEHWRDVAEDGKDKNNIYALGWYFYTIEKE